MKNGIKTFAPTAGWGKEALLNQAEHLRGGGKISAAIGYFDKYLLKDPENIEVMGRRGICLCIEAVSSQSERNFSLADEALKSLLQKKWNWIEGHHARIDLYLSFERIDTLLTEYESILNEKDFRKDLCLELIKVINLTIKFKENPPSVFTNEDQGGKKLFLRSFWPSLIGVPFLLWVAYEISSLPHALEGGNAVILFFIFSFVVVSIIVLVYICMRLYKKNQSTSKEVKKIAEKN